jgi:uncharacterized protein YdbL (DUF1318 family)
LKKTATYSEDDDDEKDFRSHWPDVVTAECMGKARFESTAQKTGTSVAQVANRFYELAVQKTAAGHYYQDPGGRWRKK